MIYVHRKPDSEPIILKNNGDSEHLEAHNHFRKQRKKYVPFNSFVIYTDPEVRFALTKLFNGKCAYCESIVVKTSDIDKEHFRPKSEIKDYKLKKNIKPGYYWLSAKWENLLLSCAHCNRSRTNIDKNGKVFTSGKQNWFPLSDQTKRAKYGQSLIEEEKVRLLINPCIENPEKMIAYTDDGDIVPAIGIDKHKANMVKESVKIYALHRSSLYKARKEKRLDTLYVIENLKDRFQKYLNESNDENLNRLKNDLNQLKKLKQKDQEYLGIARYFIRKELNELKQIIKTLTLANE